jgi:hypothetical protein
VGLSRGFDWPGRGARILTALVIGSANTLEEDLRRAGELFTPDLIIGCNHAARDHPGPVDHWVTMHPDLFRLWVPERRAAGRPDAGAYWHARHRIPWDGVESRPVESWGGSSGLLCVAVAFELGCERIVLAGVPMLPNCRHFDSDRRWDEARAYHRAWEARLPLMRARVKSMSGWTRDLLGSPEGEWFGNSTRPTAAAP